MLTPEQILAAQKANAQTLFNLTAKAFESVEKLVDLNVATAKAVINDSASHVQATLEAKDAQELLNLQASLMQPLAEKTAAYSRHLYEIASQTGTTFGKAIEEQSADVQKQVMGFVDNAMKNAPAGSESATAIMKNAVAAANNAFESVQKVVKQATETAEANLTAMTDSAINASKAATNAAKKR